MGLIANMNMNNLKIIFLHNLNKYIKNDDDRPESNFRSNSTNSTAKLINGDIYKNKLQEYIAKDKESKGDLTKKFEDMNNCLYRGHPATYLAIHDFDFNFVGVDYENRRNTEDSRKMFNEYFDVYQKWINHWNNDGQNSQKIVLMRNYQIDHFDLQKTSEIYCSRMRIKIKEDLDVLNYEDLLIENQTKILNYKCLIDRDNFESKLLTTDKYNLANNKKNVMTLYNLSWGIVTNLLENGYIKGDTVRDKTDTSYNTKCTSCDILKDFITEHNENKSNNKKMKYIEKYTKKNIGLFFDTNEHKICTAEIE
jgi:hypothetical protein